MESLFILIPVAILIVGLAVFVLFWAVRSGQFEDLDTESKRILFDEAPKPTVRKNQAEKEQANKPEISKNNDGGGAL